MASLIGLGHRIHNINPLLMNISEPHPSVDHGVLMIWICIGCSVNLGFALYIVNISLYLVADLFYFSFWMLAFLNYILEWFVSSTWTSWIIFEQRHRTVGHTQSSYSSPHDCLSVWTIQSVCRRLIPVGMRRPRTFASGCCLFWSAKPKTMH